MKGRFEPTHVEIADKAIELAGIGAEQFCKAAPQGFAGFVGDESDIN